MYLCTQNIIYLASTLETFCLVVPHGTKIKKTDDPK